METKTGTLICRKCQGPHLTIKCGKDKVEAKLEDTPKPITHVGRKSYYEMQRENNMKNGIPEKSEEKSFEKNFEKPFEKTFEKAKEYNTKPFERTFEKSRNYDDKPNHMDRPRTFRTTYRVKLSNLPIDMTEEEMMHMTCDWGHIVRLKVLNYEETSVAYIDFGHEDEANYFVEAIDRTPFDMLLLTAERKDREVVKEMEV